MNVVAVFPRLPVEDAMGERKVQPSSNVMNTILIEFLCPHLL